MIRNGSITYGAIESRLLTWRAEEPFLHAFLVGVVTTIIAYQTTAIFFDLFVGFKESGQAEITDIGAVLLAEECSILSAAASIFNSDIMRRLRFRGSKLTGFDDDRNKFRIRVTVMVKFLVLFTIAPIASLLSILISLERDMTVTFGRARFEGIALGIASKPAKLLLTESFDLCHLIKTDFKSNEFSAASFFACVETTKVNRAKLYPATTFSISISAQEEIILKYQSPNLTITSIASLDISIDGVAYRVKTNASLVQGKYVVEHGLQKLNGVACSAAARDVTRHNPQGPTVRRLQDRTWNFSQPLECDEYPDQQLLRAFSSMDSLLTVVNTDRLEVVRTSDLPIAGPNAQVVTDFIRGDNFPLLKRRRSYVSFAILCIISACILICRVLLRLLTNNDIDMGIELIVKDSLGIKYCDSMLQSLSTVYYYDRSVQ